MLQCITLSSVTQSKAFGLWKTEEINPQSELAMTSLSCFIHSAYCCFLRWDMGECCKRNSWSFEHSHWETAALSFSGNLKRLWKNKIQHCNERKKRTSPGKHQVISHPLQAGSKNWKNTHDFPGQLREGSTLSYHRSKKTVLPCRDHRSTLWLLLDCSLHPSLFSPIARPPGIRQHTVRPSALILKLRK